MGPYGLFIGHRVEFEKVTLRAFCLDSVLSCKKGSNEQQMASEMSCFCPINHFR